MPKSKLHGALIGRGDSQASYLAAVNYAAQLASNYIYGAQGPLGTGEANGPIPTSIDLDSPVGSLEQALEELQPLWLDKAVYYHHPRYISHLNCPITQPAVAAEVIATALNTAVESWDQAAAAADIEHALIAWAAALIGFTEDAYGVFSSGGTQSNLQALTVARNAALARLRKTEMALSHSEALGRLRVLTSASAHYSIARAVRLLGMDPKAVVVVPSDSYGRMIPSALDNFLRQVHASGQTAAAVVATAGTTDRGSIDPLSEIGKVCRSYGVYLHVDAAYGGAGLLAPEARKRLAGISQADSVTLDFHKTFYQPVACSAVIFAHEKSLAHITWNADYLNPNNSPRINLADYSLQTTRRFDALKLWVTLRTVGPTAIGQAFDRSCAIARKAAFMISSDDYFRLFESPQLSTVLFSLAADPDGQHIESVRDSLFITGEAAVAVTRINGQRLFKFTILDPDLEMEDILAVLNAIRVHADRIFTEDETAQAGTRSVQG